MGSEAIQTWDLGINYVDDDISKGALSQDLGKPIQEANKTQD